MDSPSTSMGLSIFDSSIILVASKLQFVVAISVKKELIKHAFFIFYYFLSCRSLFAYSALTFSNLNLFVKFMFVRRKHGTE
jgi:hypothetical protein